MLIIKSSIYITEQSRRKKYEYQKRDYAGGNDLLEQR